MRARLLGIDTLGVEVDSGSWLSCVVGGRHRDAQKRPRTTRMLGRDRLLVGRISGKGCCYVYRIGIDVWSWPRPRKSLTHSILVLWVCPVEPPHCIMSFLLILEGRLPPRFLLFFRCCFCCFCYSACSCLSLGVASAFGSVWKGLVMSVWRPDSWSSSTHSPTRWSNDSHWLLEAAS